jgi:hypothetical protein
VSGGGQWSDPHGTFEHHPEAKDRLINAFGVAEMAA